MNASVQIVKSIKTKTGNVISHALELDDKGQPIGVMVVFGKEEYKAGAKMIASGRSGKMEVDALFLA